jgi:integrase
MGRALNKLTAVRVNSLKLAGMYGDGGGLYLKVTATGSKSWIFRYTVAGKTRDAGLGAYPEVGLARARELAAADRSLVEAGLDPVAKRRQDRLAADQSARRIPTFQEAAERVIANQEAGWRNAKHRAQWRSTLKTYAYPKIGMIPVNAVDTAAVVEILEPIWKVKPETASRLRGRIEAVLNWARARGYRTGENPATWRGHLATQFPTKSRLRPVRHHPSMPYSQVAAFVAELRQETSVAARALEFVILTAVRTNEALGAKWDEVDLENKIWTIPADRMKAKRTHRVPLSKRAIEVLREMLEIRHGPLVFPGRDGDVRLSDMAMAMILRRKKRDVASVHGFRTSLRVWAAEKTSFPREIAEEALAHKLKDSVEAAYRRTDLLEKRRMLMEAWASYCGTPAKTAQIVSMGGAFKR